jgi:hypothetical protein
MLGTAPSHPRSYSNPEPYSHPQIHLAREGPERLMGKYNRRTADKNLRNRDWKGTFQGTDRTQKT